MDNDSKTKCPSDGIADDARADYNPTVTALLSNSPPRVITSSPQVSQQIQGPSKATYTSQQNAAWNSSRRPRPPEPANYPTPLPSGFPAQNGRYPSTTFNHQNPPAGIRPQSYSHPRSFTHPRPSFNPQPDNNTRPPPTRTASQFTDVDKAKINDGDFAILTDDPPAQGEYAVIRRANEVEISGGRFVIGSSHQASVFLNNTVSRWDLKKDERINEEDLG